MIKKAWLDKLYYELGHQWTDYKCTYTFLKNGSPIFTKWKPYLEIQGTPELYNKINQRTLLINEIVLDYDGNYKEFNKIILKLKSHKFNFFAYSTKKHRCQHIHLFFGLDFAMLSEDERKVYRREFIEMFGCDTQLNIENHCIALEYAAHWKTGDKKELIAYG